MKLANVRELSVVNGGSPWLWWGAAIVGGVLVALTALGLIVVRSQGSVHGWIR